MNRVVITGAGLIAPLGRTVSLCASRIEAQESGVQRIEEWRRYLGIRCLVGAPAELKDEQKIPRHSRRSMGRLSLFAIQAAEQALASSQLPESLWRSPRTGAAIGSTMGSSKSIAETFETMLPNNDLNNLSSMKFFQCLSHTAVMNLSQYFGICGCVLAPCAACASGLQAIGCGFEQIRMGKQDCMVCGGAEELHGTVTASFDLLFATSGGYNDTPHRTPRPFDRDRDGLVCGEGAGVVILESHEHARARNAPMMAEILGYHTCASGVHLSQSNKPSMIQCMTQAMQDAQISAGDVEYVNAHATGTLQGDAEEAEALREVFGDRVPLSSVKGHIGHTLGASGAIELILSMAMMEKGLIYPTLNLEHVAPECEGLDHVTSLRQKVFSTFLKTSFGLGGINAALVCRRIRE